MNSYNKAVEKAYKDASDFLVVGLTGRTGSGCSTAAKILSSDELLSPEHTSFYESKNDLRKYRIARKFAKENWTPFVTIQVRNVLTSFLLELDFDSFKEFSALTLGCAGDDVGGCLDPIRDTYEENHRVISEYKGMPEIAPEEKARKIDKAWDVYFKIIPSFADQIKKILDERIGVGSYVKLYQKLGDNIRASGVANKSDFDPENIFALPKVINKIIKVVNRKSDRACIAIDAIRNPYEALFFKQRYSNFYLVSINTPNSERLNHLRQSHKFSEDQIKELDKKEYPAKLEGSGKR